MKKVFSGDLSNLKLHERFRLSVKALARGDKTFHKQLVRSCPPEDVVEYYDLLEASRECTIQVLPALHRILGRWELINDLVLRNRDSKHVNYFYATYREHPELSEDTCKVVEGFYSFLAERQAGIKGNNDSRRSELTANALVLFLPHLYSVHYYGVEGVYVSDETEFVPGLLDSAFCMIACYHLDKARGLIAESLGLVWPAFSSVCRSGMCLEPDIVMEAFSSPVAISLIEEFSYELEELDVESNINQEWVSSLRKTWQCYNG